MVSYLLCIISLAQLALGDTQTQLGSHSPTGLRSSSATCPSPQLSCHNTGRVSNACCMNSPGGQFALTQFWNSDPSSGPPGYLGPADSWTIHGLWPDHCDGTFDSVCDCDRSGDCSSRNKKCRHSCSREYSSITRIFDNFEQDDLLSYMKQYWKGIEGDEHLWQHEWSKHGTCVSTLEPKCYNDYRDTEEVVDYFQTAVNLFQTVDTFKWLDDAGITPSEDTTYELADIQAALTRARGVSAVVACAGKELREIWYHYNVRGSIQTGQFVVAEPDFSGSDRPGKKCPEEGIKYLPKEVSNAEL